MDREKVIDIIQKLLRLQEGTSSQGEAESAAAKVQELLFKYKLEMADVEAVIPEEERLVREEVFSNESGKNEGNWVIVLYAGVAKYNFCTVLTGRVFNFETRSHEQKIHVIGRCESVEVVHYLCNWLVPRIRDLAKTAWNDYNGNEKRGRFTRGFLLGAALGIRQRLHAEWDAMQGTENSRALVVLSSQELQDYMSKKYPFTMTRRSHYTSSWDGREIGVEAGRNMEIHRGVTGKSTARLGSGQ